MNLKTFVSGVLATLLLASCAKEMNQPAPSVKPAGKYFVSATASDAMTKSYFKEDEAPTKYIYWESGDVFDFHDLTAAGDVLSETGITSSVPSALSEDGKTVSFEPEAHDYLVITYPKDAVTLTSVGATSVQASITIAAEQPLSSVLTPEVVPMATFPIALSDEAKAAVEAGSAIADVFGDEPVKMYPLAGIVKMHIAGLPDVTTAKISKVIFGSNVSGTAGKGQVGLTGENVFELKDTVNHVSTFATNDNVKRNRLVLTAEEGKELVYTAEEGVDVCFAANHSFAEFTTLTVTVFTEDGNIYKKSLNLNSLDPKRPYRTSKSRITSFTMNFSGATVSTPEDLFAVEWAEGFLTYDADGKAYKIAQPDEIGLFFKFGSAIGYAFFTDELYADHLLNAENYASIMPQQGTTEFYSDFSMYSQPDWTPVPTYVPSGSEVTASSTATAFDYLAQNGSAAFKGSTDPCSYVKVGSGENSWRVPTIDEIKDLIARGSMDIQAGNLDGTAMNGSDNKVRYAIFSDGEQDVQVRMNGIIAEAIAYYSPDKATYHRINSAKSYKTNVYFWSSTFNGAETASTASSQAGQNFTMSLGGALNLNDLKASTATQQANKLPAANANSEYILWNALNVRCVRDKETADAGSKAATAQFSVNDYGTYE